jgi:hypothetical protein
VIQKETTIITANPKDNTEAKAEQAPTPEGTRLATILHSERHELYRVPAMDKPVWLSVVVFPVAEMPAAEDLRGTVRMFVVQQSADGKGWRRSYSTGWGVIKPGDHVTVPADDPMVLDYGAVK